MTFSRKVKPSTRQSWALDKGAGAISTRHRGTTRAARSNVSFLAVCLHHLVTCILTFPTGCKTVMIAPLGVVTFQWKYYPYDKRPQAKGHCMVQQRSSCLVSPPGAITLPQPWCPCPIPAPSWMEGRGSLIFISQSRGLHLSPLP